MVVICLAVLEKSFSLREEQICSSTGGNLCPLKVSFFLYIYYFICFDCTKDVVFEQKSLLKTLGTGFDPHCAYRILH